LKELQSSQLRARFGCALGEQNTLEPGSSTKGP
jgi:hypothetical protein